MVFMTLSMIAIVLTILLVQQDIDIEIASSQSRMTKIGPMRSGRSASQHLQYTVNAKMNRILEIKALHQKDATPLLKNNQHKKTTVVYPAKTETTSEFKNAEKKTSSAIDNILFEPMMKSQPSLKSKKTLGIRSKKRQSQISREADRAVVDSASKRAQYMNHQQAARDDVKNKLSARLAKKTSCTSSKVLELHVFVLKLLPGKDY
jgi:hypothetical protein